MAVIKTGSFVADIRGSVGDETYARGQGGLYVKARKGPSGEPTQAQLDCQATITALSQYWSADLTEQQRTDWRTYAHQHPRPNRWGLRTLTNGYTRFVRLNFTAYRNYPAVAFLNPPPQPPLHPPIFTFTANAAYDEITIAVPPTTYDPPFQHLELFAFGGDNVNPGVNFYAGPWRYLHSNYYDGDDWDSDPWEIEYPLNLISGDKVFVKLIAQHNIGGQLSEPFQTSAIMP